MKSFLTKHGRIILIFLALSGLFAVWSLYRSSMSPKNIRNVLLISIDTCRADRLSCYGYEFPTTPNIDALAAESILFKNVISPIPQTLPAHSSMLTGTIPPYHGVHHNFGYLADESNTTLAEILKDAGFTTGAAISASVLDSQFGIDQGFDTYQDHMETSLEGNSVAQRQGGETTAVALDWLADNKDERFFFFLHYFDPHTNYEPPEPFASRFAQRPYAGEIAYTDYCIGRVLAKLKELGLYDSTLIIITADHGEMIGEHGEPTHKFFIYQGAIKVPLIVKSPGQDNAATIESIAGIIDIVPTVCSLLNIQTPEQVQGVDLSAALKGKPLRVQDRHLFCESLEATKYDGNSLLGVVNNRHKYIQTTRPELYDLIEDAAESNNLVKQQPQQAGMMQDELAQILERSVRQGSPESKPGLDAEAIKQLQSLGYVGGSVIEDFSFDQTKDDPKDLLKYHLLEEEMEFYFAREEYGKAATLAQQLIQLRPDCFLPYNTLGSIALAGKDYSRVIVYCQKVIDLEPDNAKAYVNRGVAYGNTDKHDRAIRDFDKAIELDPGNTNAYKNRGLAYLDKGDNVRAIRDYDKVIEMDPDNASAYVNRGFAYGNKGEHDRAIRDSDKAIELDPNNAEAYVNRGVAYGNKGEHERAIRDFDKAIQLDPNNTKAYVNRGFAYGNKGEHERAIGDFDKAIELDPNNALTHEKIGAVLMRLGRAKEAVSHYRQALDLRGDWPEMMNNLAWILATHEDAQVRDGAEAIRLAERACQLTGFKVAVLQDTLAAAYAEAGQFEKAVETAESAIRLAHAASGEKLSKKVRKRLQLYKADRPYREPSSP